MIRMTLAPSRLTLILITLLALGSSSRTHEVNRKHVAPRSALSRSIRPRSTTSSAVRVSRSCSFTAPWGICTRFRTQAQTFATRFRVIAYSRRFYPPNAPPRAQDVNALSTHVADLRALIKELKATPAHLVGYSYGAYVALALAVDHPELVRSLVLGEPPVLPLLSRTAVGEATRQSWSDGSSSQRGRRWRAGIARKVCDVHGRHLWEPGCFDNLPQSRTNGVGGKASASVPIAADDRDVLRLCLPSTVGIWGS